MNEDVAKKNNEGDNYDNNRNTIVAKDIRNSYKKLCYNGMFNINNSPKIFNFLLTVGDSSGSVISYIFQDSFMKEAWNNCGKIVMVDSTFGVTNYSTKMFTLMVIYPEIFSQICCIFIQRMSL